MNADLTLATSGDVPDIMRAVATLKAKSPAPQMKFANLIEAECSIRYAIHEGRAWFIYGYFIMVDVGKDWYTTEKYLIEQLVLRVYNTGINVQYAVAALQDIAEHYACAAIVVGDSQIGLMETVYQDQGYVNLGVQLFKESNHRLHS